MSLLDLNSAKEAILGMARQTQAARIYTYSFRPMRWVEELLAALPVSDIYISCQEDQKRLPYELPDYLRHHRYHRLESSHMKAFAFKNRGGSYSAVVGSLNAVETDWEEICYRTTSVEARTLWNKANFLRHTPHDLQPESRDRGLEFTLSGSFLSLPPSRRSLRERATRALTKIHLLDDWSVNFLRSMRDNYIVPGKRITKDQLAILNEKFEICGV